MITGDAVIGWTPFMGDGYPEDWVATLDRLAQLDFTHIVMGHGDLAGRDWLAPSAATSTTWWRRSARRCRRRHPRRGQAAVPPRWRRPTSSRSRPMATTGRGARRSWATSSGSTRW